MKLNYGLEGNLYMYRNMHVEEDDYVVREDENKFYSKSPERCLEEGTHEFIRGCVFANLYDFYEKGDVRITDDGELVISGLLSSWLFDEGKFNMEAFSNDNTMFAFSTGRDRGIIKVNVRRVRVGQTELEITVITSRGSLTMRRTRFGEIAVNNEGQLPVTFK